MSKHNLISSEHQKIRILTLVGPSREDTDRALGFVHHHELINWWEIKQLLIALYHCAIEENI